MRNLLGTIAVAILMATPQSTLASDPLFRPVALSLNLAETAVAAPGDADNGAIVGEAASTSGFLASNHEGYQGGRGIVTIEGISGMFLNPTSGTLGAGQTVAQYCVAILAQNGDTEYQHTFMFAHGVTDWLEVGAFGRWSEPDNSKSDIGAGGPLVRVRLLKEDGIIPELSVGALSRNGNDALTKHTVFIAASKRCVIDEDAIVKSVRTHAGFRQLWQDSDRNEANGSIVFVGIDVELPYDLYLVSEVSNKDDVFNHVPFSVGVQWRPNGVIGMSTGVVQTGGEDRISFFWGIGVNIQAD